MKDSALFRLATASAIALALAQGGQQTFAAERAVSASPAKLTAEPATFAIPSSALRIPHSAFPTGCGPIALSRLAEALRSDAGVSQRLLETPSPERGLSMAELLVLARTNGLDLEAVRRPAGAAIPVPSIIHWKLGHYSAVTDRQGENYRLADPLFGAQAWASLQTIEAGASGAVLLPKGQVSSVLTPLTDAEAARTFGSVVTNAGFYLHEDQEPPTDCCDDGDDQDSDCDPPSPNDGADDGNGSADPPPCCCDLGMPTWQVSEPYITLWLIDRPLSYRTSNGKWMPFKLTYKSRGLNRGTGVSSFGPRWECNWLGTLQVDPARPDAVTNYLAGGGFRVFTGTGVPEYKTARVLLPGSSGTFQVQSPRGAVNHYGNALGYLTGTNHDQWGTNYFMDKRSDRYGRAIHYYYSAEDNGAAMRVRSVTDIDGRTNSLAYDNTSFPNLITSVADPYGRTAHFNYDEKGRLTNIVDMAGMPSSFIYATNGDLTTLITPYGQTTFSYTNLPSPLTPFPDNALLVTEATGDQQLFAYCNAAPDYIPYPYTSSRLSFHWNRSQYAAVSGEGKTNVLAMPLEDYRKATVKYWLTWSEPGLTGLSDTLGAVAGPLDLALGLRPGCLSFTYYGQGTGSSAVGTLKRVAKIYLDGTLLAEIERNNLGRPTGMTYYNSGGSIATYVNTFDASARFLQTQTGPRSELLRGYGFHPLIPGLLTSVTNAAGEVICYTHDTNTLKVTSITFPSGLVRTNFYYTNGPSQGFLQRQIDIGLRTNSFAYDKGNLVVQTNELGLVTTNTWDALNRLTNTAYPDGTSIANVYDKLDLLGVKDRLGHWTTYGYNLVRQVVAETNVNLQVTTYDYCGCGSPSQITRWDGSRPVPTTFLYDIAGRLTNTAYADGYQVNRAYDEHNRLKIVTDSGSRHLELDYASVGLRDKLSKVSLVSGQLVPHLLLAHEFDEYGLVINSIDRNGVSVTNGYDSLHRLTARQAFGAYGQQQTGLETFVYDARGLTNYFDQLGHPTIFVRDAAGRGLFETNANQELLKFTYNASDELLTLTDGKGQTTGWNYDEYGRVTNKVDATGAEMFRYAYDPNDRLTNRWTPAKGNTRYVFDNVGNLLSINYAQAVINYGYDGLNHLRSIADATSTNTFTWTDGDQLASETGPWASSTVSYTYDNRLRSTLSLQQPNASAWTQTYAYDEFGRLTNTTSQAGTFGYQYADIYSGSSGGWTCSDLIQELDFPNGSYSRRVQDDLGRLLQVALTNSSGNVLDLHGYAYDLGSQRTQQVFTAGNYVNYTYDNIQQLTGAHGRESGNTPRLHEQFDYVYDPAWNLNHRTNNSLVQRFDANTLNQLTNITRDGTLTVVGTTTSQATNAAVNGQTADIYGDLTFAKSGFTPVDGANTFTAVARDAASRSDTNTVTANLPASSSLVYDANGNLRTNGDQIMVYDDENRLVTNSLLGGWKSEFVYDGLSRRRIERDYGWRDGVWVLTNETRLVYDGSVPIQHRNSNNSPWLTLTRGLDLSGTLQGAAGVGGLLAFTQPSTLSLQHTYYHGDGNGNVTTLLSTSQVVVAHYAYDPFGGTLAVSGAKAGASPYRFSSKAVHEPSGMYDFLYRWYTPSLQRWCNRDPIEETGGINLYEPFSNDSVNGIDSNGLWAGTKLIKVCKVFWESKVLKRAVVAEIKDKNLRDATCEIKKVVDTLPKNCKIAVETKNGVTAETVAKKLSTNGECRGPEGKNRGPYRRHYNPSEGPYKDVHVEIGFSSIACAVLIPNALEASRTEGTTVGEFSAACAWDVLSGIDPVGVTDLIGWLGGIK